MRGEREEGEGRFRRKAHRKRPREHVSDDRPHQGPPDPIVAHSPEVHPKVMHSGPTCGEEEGREGGECHGMAQSWHTDTT